jgi:acetyl esterase/lipase
MKTNIQWYCGILFLIILIQLPFNGFGQESGMPVEQIYKQTDTVKLKMLIYRPTNFRKTEKYPAIVFFFGGGWVSGTINQFRPFADHCVLKGMVAVLVDYRVRSRQNTTPFESLKDAKSAIRYLRQNGADLGIDTAKIIASGGSAGGHLAAACFTNTTINETGDNLDVSAKPNAMVLFNPVIDNSAAGYGYDRVGERYLEFSPLHNIRKGFPPTIFFLGTKDKLIPVATAEKFKHKIDSVGSRCELHLFEGMEHGFFNKSSLHEDLFSRMDYFFDSNGLQKNK